MAEEKSILVSFTSEENQFYDLFMKLCSDKGTTPADAIKEMIKMNLSWGQLTVRKKKGGK